MLGYGAHNGWHECGGGHAGSGSYVVGERCGNSAAFSDGDTNTHGAGTSKSSHPGAALGPWACLRRTHDGAGAAVVHPRVLLGVCDPNAQFAVGRT